MKEDNMICEQCTFLLDTEEDFLQTSSSDTSQSLPLNGTNTPVKSLDNEQPMDGFQICECGKEMSNCLIHPNTPEAWIAFMQDSLAKTLALLENKQELVRGQDRGFTEKFCALLASLDPDTSSWKMLPQLPQKVLTKFSKTLPRWGMMQNGSLYAHPMSERRISGTGGSASRLFPTPTVTSGAQVAWDKTPKQTGGTTLAGYVQWFPTPTSLGQKPTTGGQLNPMFVEWLMGFPIGFTVLEDWAMHKWHYKRQLRTDSSEDK
jgi:hypothetical protein